VTGAIVGARNAEQVEGNVDATTLRLTTKEIAEIEGKKEKKPALVTAA
jgi:aryl-alcohol dehydrogenase-like predicted oxidoreductase